MEGVRRSEELTILAAVIVLTRGRLHGFGTMSSGCKSFGFAKPELQPSMEVLMPGPLKQNTLLQPSCLT